MHHHHTKKASKNDVYLICIKIAHMIFFFDYPIIYLDFEIKHRKSNRFVRHRNLFVNSARSLSLLNFKYWMVYQKSFIIRILY